MTVRATDAGFHKYRERLFMDECHWLGDEALPTAIERTTQSEEAKNSLQKRTENVRPHVRQNTRSERGRLFEETANLMNEDDGREFLPGKNLESGGV